MRLASQGGTRPLCRGRSALPVRRAICPEIGASRRKGEGLGHFPMRTDAGRIGPGNISRCRCVSVETAEKEGGGSRVMNAKSFLIVMSAAALFAASQASAQSPASRNQNTPGDATAKPGKVGPGSENNAHVSPTSPSMTSPTPPELPPGSSSGASSGSSGKSSSDTATPEAKPSGSGGSTPGSPHATNPSHY